MRTSQLMSRLRSASFFVALIGFFACSCGVFDSAYGRNAHPVVFVHGFGGFGRSEGLGFCYWGGHRDLQEVLKLTYPDQQFFTAAVGPFSSNWDRAVELFYQIKGGCVDYGSEHSTIWQHLRVGRCFQGLYPAWDKDHPIHIVSHSMGGQTARTLVQLLAANGAPKNPDLFGKTPVGNSWVRSITTLAAPHDGTTLADLITDFMPFAQSLVAGMATLASGLDGVTHFIYDFKLDQWGIQPQSQNESFPDYLRRVMASPLWTDRSNRDLSGHDLTTKGAATLNAWVKDQPNVYYFSYSTQSTWTGVTGWEYPLPLTNPLISIFAGPAFMGHYSRQEPAYPVIDRSWWPNDGIVNTRSMKAPTIRACSDEFCERTSLVKDARKGEPPALGAWNWQGIEDGLDHMDIIGWSLQFDSVSFYKNIIDMLRGL